VGRKILTYYRIDLEKLYNEILVSLRFWNSAESNKRGEKL
jgi:hypothetical protein